MFQVKRALWYYEGLWCISTFIQEGESLFQDAMIYQHLEHIYLAVVQHINAKLTCL